MSRFSDAAKAKTIELIRYNNMVRQYLAPPEVTILDYTRAHANDIFHQMWISNSISAEKDYAYRVFREWSLVKRGIEELNLTGNEIKGALKWAKNEVQQYRAAMDDEIDGSSMKAFRADLFIKALYRLHKWDDILGQVLDHVRNHIFDGVQPAEINQPCA